MESVILYAIGDGQGGLACCDSWGRKESDMIEQLNWTDWLTGRKGFPGTTSGKEPAYQCRRLKRCRFEPRIKKNPWRRAWQPTSVFLPGESHGQRSLPGYRPQVHKKLDMAEVTKHACNACTGQKCHVLEEDKSKMVLQICLRLLAV